MNAHALLQMLKGALLTLEITSLALILGLLGGLVLGILNCQKLKFFPLSPIISTYVSVIRGTPLFVQILMIYFGLPSLIHIDLSPFFAGVLALGINSTAYIAETVRGGLNTIPTGQWDASKVLGYTLRQTLRFVIVPQTLKNILPSLTNEFINLIKESSILMILGVPELTKVSKDIVARELNPMQIYLMTALIYFLMTSILSWISKKIEGKKHVTH